MTTDEIQTSLRNAFLIFMLHYYSDRARWQRFMIRLNFSQPCAVAWCCKEYIIHKIRLGWEKNQYRKRIPSIRAHQFLRESRKISTKSIMLLKLDPRHYWNQVDKEESFRPRPRLVKKPVLSFHFFQKNLIFREKIGPCFLRSGSQLLLMNPLLSKNFPGENWFIRTQKERSCKQNFSRDM